MRLLALIPLLILLLACQPDASDSPVPPPFDAQLYAPVRPANPAVPEPGPSAPEAFRIPEQGTLEVHDETFVLYYDRLYAEQERVYGRRISLAGIVLRDDKLGPGEFLLGRNYVWCCEDDSHFIGFLAFGLPEVPADGLSLRLEGWLEPRLYTDPDSGKSFSVPAIRVDRAYPDSNFSPDVFPVAGALAP